MEPKDFVDSLAIAYCLTDGTILQGNITDVEFETAPILDSSGPVEIEVECDLSILDLCMLCGYNPEALRAVRKTMKYNERMAQRSIEKNKKKRRRK